MNNKENYRKAIDQIHANENLKNSTFEKIEAAQKIRRPAFVKYIAACAVFVVVFAVGAFYLKDGKKQDDSIQIQTQIATAENDLPRFENIEQLREILKENNSRSYYAINGDLVDYAMTATAEESVSTTGTTKSTTNTESDYSKTNTQVEDVDEADIVKTDGKYIYYVTLGKTYIINAQNLKVASVIEINEKQYRFSPNELYINGNKLVLMGNSYEYKEIKTELEEEEIYYDYSRSYQNTMSKALVFDITDKKNPKQEREVALDGYYNNSRMIGDSVYFISTKGMYYYNTMTDDELLPIVKDTAVSNETSKIACTDIAYFEGSTSYSYLMVAGFNINKKEPASTETFFGASEEIYASKDNLYITQTNYKYFFDTDLSKSEIYKFNLTDSQIKLQASAEVKGTINNQFSMDEYDGKLRIATTSNQYDEDNSKNQLFILDENLDEISRIDNMAKGEKIYSVRFVGKVGYIVTFKQIDPLFVIDLSDPYNPEIKGELKIPGYSSYLHPYDETHIIGIGYNTKSNGYGGVTNDNMKMSMFDLSDLSNPKEMFSIDIGSKYTYSEITSNHKALFYNKEKNLIGFPISTWEYDYRKDRDNLILYQIDLNKGFVEYGKIEQTKDWKTNIRRAIYIGDTLYTLAHYKVTSYGLDDLEKIDELELEE